MKPLLAVVLAIALIGFGTSRTYDWWNFNVYTPVSTTSHTVSFQVDQGELPTQIADDLYSKKLIRDRNVFALYLRFTGAGARFEAGKFILNLAGYFPLYGHVFCSFTHRVRIIQIC